MRQALSGADFGRTELRINGKLMQNIAKSIEIFDDTIVNGHHRAHVAAELRKKGLL